MKFKRNIFSFFIALLLSSILLFFRIPISRLLDFLFVRPLFSAFEGGFSLDILLFFLLVCLSTWISVRQNIEALSKLLAVVLIFYILQRTNTYWIFYKMTLLPQFAYWDLVAMMGLLALPLCVLNTYTTLKVENEGDGTGFIEDNPVLTCEGDHFKRNGTAAEIARLIMCTPNKKSFAIGILGEYGSGKTSFLNLINLALGDKEIIKISFDVWTATNPEMIRREFFDLLASTVAEVDPKMSSLIYNYGRKLAGFDKRSLNLLNWLGFLKNESAVQSSGEYQQINHMLQSTGRKVIVTIDDLDRLYPSEIVEVLKLIRNTGNFANVVYLVAYDRRYLQSALLSLNDSAEGYLEKIFQLEIPMPKREDEGLMMKLQSNFKEILTDFHFNIFEKMMIPNRFLHPYEKAFSGILRQSRDVVRFTNSFKIAYVLIGDEVDIKCLILVELIKFRYPEIYDLLYKQVDTFLYETPLRATHEQFFSPRLLKNNGVKNGGDEISAFRTHLERINGLNYEDVSQLDGLFMTLFNGSKFQHPEPKNSISYPLYFEIYFRFRLSQSSLSDKDYQAAKVSGHMQDYMAFCASNNLHKELMTRLMQEDILTDRLHFETVIRWIVSFGQTFVKKEGKFRFDFESLVDKIYDYGETISIKLYKKDSENYRRFIDQLLSTSQPPFQFENELIYHLKQRGGDFVLSNSELAALQLSYFTQYAETSHGLNEEVLWIFWGAREYYTFPADSSGAQDKLWRFEPDLAAKMKIFLVNKDPKEFLKFSINYDMRERSRASIYKEVLEMFADPAEYRKIVAENPLLDEEIRQEYLELFDKLVVNDFKQYVEMEFKTPLLSRTKN